MKKIFFLSAIAAMAALSMTSSSSDDDETVKRDVITSSNGVYILNAGNKSAGVDGSITYYDNATQAVSQKVYQAANGSSLGRTVNDAVTYGSKIYIVGTNESTVFVADRKTMKKTTNIQIKVDGEAASPRHVVAYGGHVYVSTYKNVVLDIDTLTLLSTKTYTCGNYSEGMTICNGYLYTADSDYGKAEGNASITKIDLATGKSETIKNANIVNAVDIKCYNNRLFYLDSGSYDASWNQSGQGIYELLADGTSKKVCSATGMALANGKIYYFDAPYTYPATTPSFGVYDIATEKTSQFIDGTDIVSPCAIAVDVQTNKVYISSYNMVDGYTSYKTDGYCVIYDTTGKKLQKITTGVGPSAISFNYDYK